MDNIFNSSLFLRDILPCYIILHLLVLYPFESVVPLTLASTISDQISAIIFFLLLFSEFDMPSLHLLSRFSSCLWFSKLFFDMPRSDFLVFILLKVC